MSYFKYTKNTLFVERVSALNLAKKFKTPLYCYSLSQIEKNFLHFKNTFKKIKPLICYAVKANSNNVLLKKLKALGSGADVVSAGELMKVLNAGINPKKIVFSGVGKTREELEIAIKKKILLINVESLNEAMQINKIGRKISKKISIGLRLNPDITGKTHRKISTGGKNEKFGLIYKDFINFCKKIKQMKNLKLEGLSVHIGSQIMTIKPFSDVLKIIDKIINKTKINFKYIDLGGGMGISYSLKQKKLNLKKYSKIVEKFTINKNAKIIFEPGRFIVGDSAILIAKIIYIKKSNKKIFVIMDAGMNNLMRPALYDAPHEIIPIKKINKRFKGNIEFVGPVCESTDKFLNKKNFEKIEEGNYLALTNVGAYGTTLESNYNVRPNAAEIMISGSICKLIRKRQSLKNLIEV